MFQLHIVPTSKYEGTYSNSHFSNTNHAHTVFDTTTPAQLHLATMASEGKNAMDADGHVPKDEVPDPDYDPFQEVPDSVLQDRLAKAGAKHPMEEPPWQQQRKRMKIGSMGPSMSPSIATMGFARPPMIAAPTAHSAPLVAQHTAPMAAQPTMCPHMAPHLQCHMQQPMQYGMGMPAPVPIAAPMHYGCQPPYMHPGMQQQSPPAQYAPTAAFVQHGVPGPGQGAVLLPPGHLHPGVAVPAHAAPKPGTTKGCGPPQQAPAYGKKSLDTTMKEEPFGPAEMVEAAPKMPKAKLPKPPANPPHPPKKMPGGSSPSNPMEVPAGGSTEVVDCDEPDADNNWGRWRADGQSSADGSWRNTWEVKGTSQNQWGQWNQWEHHGQEQEWWQNDDDDGDDDQAEDWASEHQEEKQKEWAPYGKGYSNKGKHQYGNKKSYDLWNPKHNKGWQMKAAYLCDSYLQKDWDRCDALISQLLVLYYHFLLGFPNKSEQLQHIN